MRAAGAPVAATLLLGAAILAGCSEHQDLTEPDPGGSNVSEVELVDFAFSPAEVRVDAGTTVRWRNTTSTFHTATPDGHGAWSEWQTSGTGETFQVRFDQPGVFDYYCLPHRALGMRGSVIVQ